MQIERTNYDGIPGFKVTIGHYLRDWEIQDRWNAADEALKKARLEGLKITEEKSPLGTFRHYTVETDPTKNPSF